MSVLKDRVSGYLADEQKASLTAVSMLAGVGVGALCIFLRASPAVVGAVCWLTTVGFYAAAWTVERPPRSS